jgi:hypothetical protein
VHCRVEALGQEGTESRVLNRRSTTRGKSNKWTKRCVATSIIHMDRHVFLFIRALNKTAAPGGVLTAVFIRDQGNLCPSKMLGRRDALNRICCADDAQVAASAAGVMGQDRPHLGRRHDQGDRGPARPFPPPSNMPSRGGADTLNAQTALGWLPETIKTARRSEGGRS